MKSSTITEINLKKFINEVSIILRKIWIRPQVLLEEINNCYNKLFVLPCEQIVISGETENISIYLIYEDFLVAIMPFLDIRENELLRRWNIDWTNDTHINSHYQIINLDNKIRYLLNMPKVLLINLSNVENFPIPRLNLSTGVIASYLRKKQLANVHIIDMQIGTSLNCVVEESISLNPDIIGISVSFGEKDLAYSLLDKLYSCNIKSLITVGNIIPALYPEDFINKFPSLIVSYSEGEVTMPDLLQYIQGNIPLNEVRGIIFSDNTKNTLVKTISNPINTFEISTPALDTLEDISVLKGVLTLETSRGCDYAKCTFCPRQHKLDSWRYLTPKQVVTQIDHLVLAGNAVGIKPHVYLADEEFIGELPDGSESVRVIDICKELISRNIKFDTSARADSVYNHSRSLEWNLEKIEMWYYCKLAGLDRLFVGLESGCKNQLIRFGKGTTVEQNIIALRILTALGINIRIGFIMFDPLMLGLDDIKENLAFLERTDAIMNPIDITKISFEEFYNLLVNDETFVKENSKGIPVYSLVSYMLASLEVLVGSPYIKMIKNMEEKYKVNLIENNGKPDANMGRYITKYLDANVGSLSLACQKWIDSNFSIMYTIKSLHKAEKEKPKHILYNYMVRYREICQNLLKYLVYNLEEQAIMDLSLSDFINKVNFPKSLLVEAQSFRTLDIDDRIISYMNQWQHIMSDLLNDVIKDLDTGIINDTYDNRLKMAIEHWFCNRNKWRLINDWN